MARTRVPKFLVVPRHGKLEGIFSLKKGSSNGLPVIRYPQSALPLTSLLIGKPAIRHPP
jgi:hypothetical protein